MLVCYCSCLAWSVLPYTLPLLYGGAWLEPSSFTQRTEAFPDLPPRRTSHVFTEC